MLKRVVLYCVVLGSLGFFHVPPGLAGDEDVDRPPAGFRQVAEWTFDDGAQEWKPGGTCRIEARDGRLKVMSTGEDPQVTRNLEAPGGRMMVGLRLLCRGKGGGQLFWSTTALRGFRAGVSAGFTLHHDGKWHDYMVPIQVNGDLVSLRFDPGSGPGTVVVDRIRLYGTLENPLEINEVEVDDGTARLKIGNRGKSAIRGKAGTKEFSVKGGKAVSVECRLTGGRPFETIAVTGRLDDVHRARRDVYVYSTGSRDDWPVLESAECRVWFAPDGSGARVDYKDRPVAVIAPLAGRRTGPIALEPAKGGKADTVSFRGDGVEVSFSLAGNEILVSVESDDTVEGPVVRAFGSLEQGVFAGLEYLGKGERSSTDIDVGGNRHLRYRPNPMKVTMPLMAFVTDRGTLAMTWKKMGLQPTYATPNFLEGTPEHRMSLSGTKIQATVFVGGRAPVTETIAWAVGRFGLPPLPKPPRDPGPQKDMCLKTIMGPLWKEGQGWGHCVGGRWKRRPYASFASTLLRLGEKVPDVGPLELGGVHVRNDAAFFLMSRVERYLELWRDRTKKTIARQRADGSFAYTGRYRRGHFEDTASGHCAKNVFDLLDYAWVTGDKKALEAGVKTLDCMKRFRTPRGAQVWELGLHVPDILASAWITWAYVRGYELTGRKDYLREARRWALSGVPFVYLWGTRPVMVYATIPVYGATNWTGTLWIGLPVQWCGTVYAYALTLLAPYDDTIDWRQLAKGILIAAEQMQVPSGANAGCLPDVWMLDTQRYRGPFINPCALVALRLAVEGKVDSLAVAADGKHRIAAPFPVSIRGGAAHITASPGVTYQVLIDGEKIVTVTSKGTDVVSLP